MCDRAAGVLELGALRGEEGGGAARGGGLLAAQRRRGVGDAEAGVVELLLPLFS